MTITIPMRIVSEANLREHWAKKARRVKQQRALVAIMLPKTDLPPLPVTVTMTRIAPRKLDKGDNLNIAFKAVRDQIAWQMTWIGVRVMNAKKHIADDADPRIDWRYAQERGGVKEYACRIDIEGRA